MKIVINTCFGGFGLSDAAYEHLIRQGVPVRAYKEQKRNPKTGLYDQPKENEGEIIFDRTLTPKSLFCDEWYIRTSGRYWDAWINGARTDPRLILAVEELGSAANGRCAQLKIIEIPDDVAWTIEEYDGREHVAEAHRTWS
jgi:hypothetical protein